MQNTFDVFRSRTTVFPVRGGNLYHYAILADMLSLHFATPPEGSPAVAHAMKAPAPPLPPGGGVVSKAAGV